MKKRFALLLTALSASGLTLFGWYTYYKTLPLPQQVGATSIEHKALLTCTNLRTLHVENSLGNIEIKAEQALVLQDHTIKAKSVIVKLQPHKGECAKASANNAEFSIPNHYFFLYGNVHAQQSTTNLFTDKLYLRNREKILVAEKNVHLQHPSGNLDADKATVELKNKTIILQGNVSSKFSAKLARTLRQ
jgi:LPS export ABC transporter protein LptC